MKLNKSVVLSFVLLILCASLYRVWEGRPWGFAPQIAMALFGGAVIKDKKWAFTLPILSLFLSDALYELLFSLGMTEIQGFYKGQVTNYVLIAGMTFFGFMIRKINWVNILAASLVAPTVYFLISNFLVWMNGGGLNRPKTFDGLMLCYADALAFYRANLWTSTLFFSIVLFGGYYLIQQRIAVKKEQAA